MAEYSKETTFWNLLQSKKVIIPIIQRDYAQGRIGQEYLRQRFLEQIFSVLTGENNETLLLDFVYGSAEHDSMYPLDGQQRLTTLWLIHWYFALVSGKLQNYANIFEKFSYQTRVSSRKFCEQLSHISYPYDYDNKKNSVTEFIRNQHWFYSSYEQDPTIQSMMNMLGGTDIEDKESNDIIDGIEEICRSKNLSKNKICELFSRLIDNNCPIKFFLLNMEDKNMPLTDDLYIKMNARGKVLTDFENFKVDLLDYKEQDTDKLLIPENNDPEVSFSHKLDTKWTDLFWCNRSSDNKIDGIMMKFFNRFFLDSYIATGCNDLMPDAVIADPFYKIMTDDKKSYQNISVYKSALTTDAIEKLTKCLDGLYQLYNSLDKNYDAIDNLLQPYWVSESDEKINNTHFYFIPKYTDEGEISRITQQQRVVFHALCLYFNDTSNHSNPIKPEELKEWLHFVWNIVENSYIDREQAVAAIRFFEKELNTLSDSNINCFTKIRLYLSTIDKSRINNNKIFGKRQLLEEIAKAKRCYTNTNNGNVDEEWKGKIEDAEKALFFKGAIAFLFNDENGQPSDWENFDTKYQTAKTIFDQKGLKDECRIDILSRFFNLCTNFEDQLWWSRKVFTCTAKTWKENILIQVDRDYKYVYASNVHHILLNDKYSPDNSVQNQRIRTLADREFVEYLLNKNSDNRDMYIRSPHDALYYCGDKQGVLLSYESRDRKLKKLLNDPRFTLRDEKAKIGNTGKFWGFDIDFIFNNDNSPVNIRWYRERNDNNYDIYIMDGNWNWGQCLSPRNDEKGDRKTYLCFNMETDNPIEEIVKNIKDELTPANITSSNEQE